MNDQSFARRAVLSSIIGLLFVGIPFGIQGRVRNPDKYHEYHCYQPCMAQQPAIGTPTVGPVSRHLRMRRPRWVESKNINSGIETEER